MQSMTKPQNHTVLQGHFKTSNSKEAVMSTILGSCVSMCIYDEAAGIGGMNHFLLPGDPDRSSIGMKYGINAVEMMINEMLKMGAARNHLKAKLFGGANMASNLKNIGQLNAEFARGFLRDEGIPIMSESLGGTLARRVRFWPSTGAAQQMMVPPTEIKTPETPAAPPPVKSGGDISLF